jgi:predicted N-acetyltransferase YhbS
MSRPPEYHGPGIGSELVRRMLRRLDELYAIDLMADPDVHPFYERLGFSRATGMVIRNYARQAGRERDTTPPAEG